MNRLLQKARQAIRRRRSLFSTPIQSRTDRSGSLIAEQLESRTLLTTLLLPEGSDGALSFIYADPEENDQGSDTIAAFNEIRIGSISGNTITEDVVVEILDEYGRDVLGTLSVPGQNDVNFGGGPGGGAIIEEVPANQVGGLNFGGGAFNVMALATNSDGQTYGLLQGGFVFRIDTTTGAPDTAPAQVLDTDNPFAAADLAFTNIIAADFGRNAAGEDVLYAVVTGPTALDGDGLPVSVDTIVITIDPATGEAEPVGVDNVGLASYPNSVIAGAAVSTIVAFDRDLTDDYPGFLGYDTDLDSFILLEFVKDDLTPELAVEMLVTTATVEDENTVISGLAFNDDNVLFGLYQTQDPDTGALADGKLVIVDLLAAPADRFTDVIEYGQTPGDVDIYLNGGMSYDPLNGMAYATDPGTSTLYAINIDRIVEQDGDYFIDGMADIHMMYVYQSYADIYITVTRFDDSGYTSTAGEGALLFFDTSVNPAVPIYTPDNAGGAMIGTNMTYLPDDVDRNDPIWAALTYDAPEFLSVTADAEAIGVWPGGAFRPGIIVEEGNDVGKIHVGGGVFGDVIVRGGSIGSFYAGYIGTNTFQVNGDLNSLITASQGGGQWDEGGTVWHTAASTVIDVQGKLGNVYATEDFGIPIRVAGRDDVPHFPGAYDFDTNTYVPGIRELENRVTGFSNGGMMTGDDLTNDTPLFTNDTILEASYLGSVDDKLTVWGQVTPADPINDAVDVYSFSALAGQSIEIRLYGFGENAPGSLLLADGGQLYGPDGVLEASMGEVVIETGAILPLKFDVEEAGIYSFVVGGDGQYRIDISDGSDGDDISVETSLGGVKVQGELQRDPGGVRSVYGPLLTRAEFRNTGLLVPVNNDKPDFYVSSGNLGGISVAGITGGVTVVEDGNIGVMEAGLSGTNVGFYNAFVTAGGTIGAISSPLSRSWVNVFAGGDLQSFSVAGEHAAGIMKVDGNIGMINVAGDYTIGFLDLDDETTLLVPSAIFANADSVVSPDPITGKFVPEGIIDVILAGGMILVDVSTGGSGGNVRFVSTGGGRTAEFDPGQSVQIIDDSGAVIKISPGYDGDAQEFVSIEERLSENFEENDWNQDGEVTIDDDINGDGAVNALDGLTGGSITIVGLEVTDISYDDWLAGVPVNSTGYAIAGIASSDGLIVSAVGGPVEIGQIQVFGGTSHEITFRGKEKISVLRLDVVTDGDLMTIVGDDDNDNGNEIDSIVNSTGGDIVSIYLDADAGFLQGEDTNGDGVIDEDDEEDTDEELENDYNGDGVVDEDDDTNGDGILDDEDIIVEVPFDTIRVEGNLGLTASTTGQKIYGTPLVEDAVFQIGIQTTGVYSLVGIKNISVAGALGHVYAAGDINEIKINSDKSLEPGEFDGLVGVIFVDVAGDLTAALAEDDENTGDTGNTTDNGYEGDFIVGGLGKISLGDGLIRPGTGAFSRAGIYVNGALGLVSVDGPGNDIEGQVFATNGIKNVSVTDGARIIGNTTLVHQFLAGMWEFGSTVTIFTDNIEKVTVKGDGSYIYGAFFEANNIRNITVSGGAEGMFYSTLEADFVTMDSSIGYINNIKVGGQGILNCDITAGTQLGNVTVAKDGVLAGSYLSGYLRVKKVVADEINSSFIYSEQRIDKIQARESTYELSVDAGRLDSLTAPVSIIGASLNIAGPVGKITTKGDLISNIEVTGPYGNLKKLSVGGDLGTPSNGMLLVEGTVGTIKVKGDFASEVRLNVQGLDTGSNTVFTPKYTQDGVELKKLSVGGKLAAFGGIGGDIGTIQSNGDFGTPGDTLEVFGDVKKFVVGKKTPGDLLADLSVNGDLGKVVVTGDVRGNIWVEDDFKSLTAKAKDPERADIFGDIYVGGDFGKLTILNGQLYGEVVVEGEGPKKTKIVEPTVVASDPVLPMSTRSISSDPVIMAAAGVQPKLFTMHQFSGTLEVGNIANTQYYVSSNDVDRIVIDGDLAEGALIIVDGNVGSIEVTGSIEGNIYVTGSIGSLTAANMGMVDDLGVTASVIAGADIEEIIIEDTIRESFILAGYDPGTGGSVDITPFENPYVAIDKTRFTLEGGADVREQANSGNIDEIDIAVLNNSVVAAGVNPGPDTEFGDLLGTDTPGSGISVIDKVVIGNVIGDGTAYGIFADTAINSLKLLGKKVPTPIMQNNGFRAWTIEEGDGLLNGFVFNSKLDYATTLNSGVDIKVKLSGPGTGWITLTPDGMMIADIKLINTTEKSSLKVSASGKDIVNIENLYTNDDASLKNLSIDGTVTDTLDIDGNVSKVKFDSYGQAATMAFGGDVKTLDLGDVNANAVAATLDVAGSVSTLKAMGLYSDFTLNAGSIGKMQIKEAFDGTVNIQDGTVSLKADSLSGFLNTTGSASKINIKNTVDGDIRVAGDIKSFKAGDLYRATVAAGGDFDTAKIKTEMFASTLAAGLDIGADGDVYSDDITVGRGDIGKVTVGTNFIGSNIAAGVAPGADNDFGTDDDTLQQRVVEDDDAPQIEDVRMYSSNGGSILDVVEIKFSNVVQSNSSNIDKVIVKGQIVGTGTPSETYAITAAGKISEVVHNRQAFVGDGVGNNTLREIANGKDILSSSITDENVATLPEALANAIQIKSDGLDGEFNTADDVYMFGPDVRIVFDKDTNSALFYKDSGFNNENSGGDYYLVTVESDKVVNRMGSQLDAEYYGEFPTGDGKPGNDYFGDDNDAFDGDDFHYMIAVGDLGDAVVTAFSPFLSAWPTNAQWTISEVVGNNGALIGNQSQGDVDYIRLNDLKKGQIVNAQFDAFGNAYGFLYAELVKIVESNYTEDIVPTSIITVDGRDDLDPVRDLVLPGLDEFAYANDMYYGYDRAGQSFYTIDPETMEPTLLPSDLADLNNLPEVTAVAGGARNLGSISDLHAITAAGSDKLWAIADFTNTTDQYLILIENVSKDTDLPAGQRPRIFIPGQGQAITANYSDITGMKYYNGILYAVDNASNTLLTVIGNELNAEYGKFSAVGGVDGNIDNTDLEIKGLSILPDGTGLLALHDQPENEFGNGLVDALYTLDTTTADADLWRLFQEDRQVSGLETIPNGEILIGLPQLGTPIGDTFEIEYDNQTLDHVFGGTEETVFGISLTFSSNIVDLPENDGGQEFIDGGNYYAMNVTYNNAIGQDIEFSINDMDWIGDQLDRSAISVTTDDPIYTTVNAGANAVTVEVRAGDGDGDFTLYFAAAGQTTSLVAADLDIAGDAIGWNSRDDITNTPDNLLGKMEEFTISPYYHKITSRVKLTPTLRALLPDDIIEALAGDLTVELRDDVLDILAIDPNNPTVAEQAIIDEFDANTHDLAYYAVALDQDMQVFTLVDAVTYESDPIRIVDENDPTLSRLLTTEYLSEIYAEQEGLLDPDTLEPVVELTDFRALKFGTLGELWMIAKWTDIIDGVSVVRGDYLMKVEDIMSPAGTIEVANGNDPLDVQGFTNITELTFGNFSEPDPNYGVMYGMDADSDTLVTIDWRRTQRNSSGLLVPNLDYGTATAVGGSMSNLGNTTNINIVAMDFDANGNLFAIDSVSNKLMIIDTTSVNTGDNKRVQVVQSLPNDSYVTLAYDPLGGQSFIVSTVTGSVLNDEINISVSNDAAVPSLGAHIFDGTNTSVNNVVFSSAGMNSESDIVGSGGYYQLDINYGAATGAKVNVTLSGIDWNNGTGDLDSVVVSDPANVTVVSFDSDTITLQIDNNTSDDEVSLYFGATSELKIPGIQTYTTELVDVYDSSSMAFGIYGFNTQLSEDGDYMLMISSGFDLPILSPFKYDLSVNVFDDGNDDFGVVNTPGGNYYDSVVPTAVPIDLMEGSADLENMHFNYDNIWRTDSQRYPVTVAGDLFEAGIANTMIVSSSLTGATDFDIYKIEVKPGQKVTVDLDAAAYSDRVEELVFVGVYNADLEAVSSAVISDPNDSEINSQQVDQLYQFQSINEMIKDGGTFEIDPMDNVTGNCTYYISVGLGYFSGDEIDYDLKIIVEEVSPIVNPASQLVYISFGDPITGTNETADYLNDEPDEFGVDAVNRPAFMPSEFGLSDGKLVRDDLTEKIAQRIRDTYYATGLTENEIKFVTEKPALGEVYSTMIFGGRTPDAGLLGIAQQVDRNNTDRDDMCAIFTEEMAPLFVNGFAGEALSDDPDERFEQVVTILGFAGAHELGHILGLEHSTEIDTDEANNIMGYNDSLYYYVIPEFEERNSYELFGMPARGYHNEVDSLLRYIGTGTEMGK
ncbi:MAG: hypothetical protein JEZ07_15480 [Phycisphaerae bacterium]|nr:hypothetical protein [Phycisphaerae bacterium]